MKHKHERARLYKVIMQYFGINEIVVLGDDGSEDKYRTGEARVSALHLVLQKLSDLNVMVCGGTTLSIFTDTPVNDLDFYMKDPSLIGQVKAFLHEYFNHGEPFFTQNAITYKRKQVSSRRVFVAQLITRFSGLPEMIFDDFDFTITHSAYDFRERAFVVGDRFFEDVAKRKLVYAGKSHYPICALHRTIKYQKRGYTVSGITLMHIALSIVQLEIKSYADLKEQLMGVDTMLLQGLLEKHDMAAPVEYGEFLAEVFQHIDNDFDRSDEDPLVYN